MNEELPAENTTVPATEIETQVSEPSQEADPVQKELDRVESAKRTKLEKLEFTKQRIDKQIAEERAKEGEEPSDLDRPLTLREFQALQSQQAQETAKSLAETEIENDAERRLTLHHLENTIKPSGDPRRDLETARTIVNAVKNGQLAEEANRAAIGRTRPSGAGAPPKQEGAKPELTREQKQYAAATGLSEEEVIKALTGK